MRRRVTSKPKVIIFDYGRTLFDRRRHRFFSGVHGLLKDLRSRYRLAIVSIANEQDPPKARLDALKREGILQYFSKIVFAGSGKDAALENVIQEMEVHPREVVVVDDRVKRSIAWGNQRGAVTIWLRKGKFADELPDKETGIPRHTIKNLSDLRELLLGTSGVHRAD